MNKKNTAVAPITPYLTFNGNCREAMEFYRDCLGGRLTFQTVGDSLLAGKMPAKMKRCILHATLKKGALVLLGTDITADAGLIKGNSVTLTLSCFSEKQIRLVYEKLAKGGTRTYPPDVTVRKGMLGTLTDKFGNHWLLSYEKPNRNSLQ